MLLFFIFISPLLPRYAFINSSHSGKVVLSCIRINKIHEVKVRKSRENAERENDSHEMLSKNIQQNYVVYALEKRRGW